MLKIYNAQFFLRLHVQSYQFTKDINKILKYKNWFLEIFDFNIRLDDSYIGTEIANTKF